MQRLEEEFGVSLFTHEKNKVTLNEAGLLANCYRNSLQLAMDNNIRRIAFPSISTGVYSYPVDQASEVAVGAVKEFVLGHPGAFDEVLWVLFDDVTKAYYDEVIEAQEGKLG